MNIIRQLIHEITVFHTQKMTIAIVLWLFAGLSGLAFSLFSGYGFAFSGVVVLSIVIALVKYEKVLEKRVDAINGGPIWQVQVNGITVGELNDSAYADIRWKVYFDSYTYIKQMLNMIAVALRLVKIVFISLPIVAFWLVIVTYLVVPESLIASLHDLQTVKNGDYSIQGMLHGLWIYSIFVICFRFLLGLSFGFINQFEKGCAEHVRRYIHCPSDGALNLYRMEDETHIVPDELIELIS